MQSAEGQVQNLRYQATFPLLINVAGQPTYFMALKDDAGLVKQFAMLDIQRYQNVAVGNTVEETQKSYLALLATNGVVSEDAEALDSRDAQRCDQPHCNGRYRGQHSLLRAVGEAMTLCTILLYRVFLRS